MKDTQSAKEVLEENKKLTSELSELKRTIEVLRNFEELYWLIFNHSSVAILVEQGGKCVFANRRLLRVSGYTHKEITSIPVVQFIHQEDRTAYFDKDKHLKIGVMDSLILRLLLKGGLTRKARIDWIGFLFDSRPAKLVFILDVTERARVKAALVKEKELNELKSRFVSMTSHEFRTPLTSILGSANIMETYREKLNDEKRQKYIDKIKENVQHMTELLNDVLMFEKIDAGKLQLYPETINFESLCDGILEHFSLLDIDNRIEYKKENANNYVVVDPKLMRQVLDNLISNAMKYSTEKIHIHVKLNLDNIIIVIRDHGIGIPPADLSRIFEPFHRASNSKNIQGTGLGLTILKRAIELHKGSIDVQSEIGKGTTFIINIPVVKED